MEKVVVTLTIFLAFIVFAPIAIYLCVKLGRLAWFHAGKEMNEEDKK